MTTKAVTTVPAHTTTFEPSGPLSATTSPASQKLKRPSGNAEERAAERRLRRRVDPSQRKRVAVACERCKRRKQKCDGRHPCHICQRRKAACVFPPGSDRRNSESQFHLSAQLTSPQTQHSNGDTSGRFESPFPDSTTDEEIVSVGEGNARLLCDPRGHFRFIGKSGAHSFIEQIRQLFRQTSGESVFTEDVERFMLADGPAHTHSVRSIQLPSRALADELTQIVEDGVQPFSYIFHMDDFRRMVDETYENPLETPPSVLCLIHLAFALASVYKPEVDTGKFFESGLGLCVDCVEDGDFWCVQAYLLISLYYQLMCKRNAFWIALGVSIRFAQALGIHQSSALQTLPPRERLLRQRVWRTLYTHDRFHSAALGRPHTIQDGDWEDSESDIESQNSRLQIQMTRIARLQGDICQQVYRPRTISSEAASALARRLQQWTDELPEEFTVETLIRDTNRVLIERYALQRLHMAHLNSVILLTRPFFFYVVTASVSNHPGSAKTANNGTVARLANACILSATRLVEMVHTLILASGSRPARPPFLIYFMLMAGLILLLDAYRDPTNLSNPSITNVKKIMGSYAHQDPSAKRYQQIFEMMEAAIRGAQREVAPTKDLLSELLSGMPSHRVQRPANESPGHISLSQFLIDTPLGGGTETGLEEGSLNFDFDFDSLSFWDMVRDGQGEFSGMI